MKEIPKKEISKAKNKKENKKVQELTPQEDIPLEKKEIIKDSYITNVIFITLVTFCIELIFKKINHFDLLDYSSLRILITTIILSIIINIISTIFPKKWIRNIINILYVTIYSIYSWLQLGFMNFLGVYISFNTSSQVGAVLDYIRDFISSFKITYYIIFIPLLLTIILYVILRKKEYHQFKLNIKSLIIIPLIILLSYSYYLTLTLSFMQNENQVQDNLKLFLNPQVPTIAVNQFGTTMFGITDLITYINPPEEELNLNIEYATPEVETSRKVSPFLESIVQSETNSDYSYLNGYFSSRPVTDYNDYTGMFEDMNVIVILIESGSNALINEEYYPNFYKLYNEGWHFNNYYSPRNSCATGNNEFSAMTSLYSIYNACTTNKYKTNTYYESIFGLFNEADYTTTSMHNYSDSYYSRNVAHNNMGSTYYGASVLNIKINKYGEWPSDIELMEKAFDIILDDERDIEKPWMTWLTTVTSHQPYSSSSTYGDLYLKEFKQAGYSTNVARYMSKLKVFDEALGVMLSRLEETGELDNTLIVMMPDHYPYGLNEKEIKEMYDTYYNDYEKEKVPLVMYNSHMEPQSIDTYTSYIDLVPTIANLVNLDYDPRLYMGVDLFSDSHESLVIFSDGSWKNEYAFYNASNSKITLYDPNHYTTQEIRNIINDATNKTAISTLAIKCDYFTYLANKREEYNNSLLVNNTENNQNINENNENNN